MTKILTAGHGIQNKLLAFLGGVWVLIIAYQLVFEDWWKSINGDNELVEEEIQKKTQHEPASENKYGATVAEMVDGSDVTNDHVFEIGSSRP